MNEERTERITKSLSSTADAALKKLGLESCIIIATYKDGVDEDGCAMTGVAKAGSGSYFAQYGSAKLWTESQRIEMNDV